jgi:serine/threonine-protein kinase
MAPDSERGSAAAAGDAQPALEPRATLGMPAPDRAPLAWRIAAFTAALLALGVLASWTHHAIESSLREVRSGSLMGVLDAEAQALDVWISEKELGARRLARDSRLRAFAEAAAREKRACIGDPPGLRESLAAFLQDETVASVRLLDAEVRPIAALPARACDEPLGEALRGAARRALAGETRFVPPSRPAAGARPLLWFLTPVADAAGRPAAVLAIGKFSDGRFASIFSQARIGRSGEAYAFDGNARIVSATHSVAAARPADPMASARLASAALAAALAGKAAAGALPDPYDNYRGESVVGAWRWLPDAGLGLAVEMEASEAYAPLAVLNAAFGVLFGVLIVALAASLVYVVWLKRQMRAVHRLGAYVLERKIGEGGMANVYLAHHALLRRPTAVKILRPEHSAGPQFIERFEREVKLASQLSHPNTVEIYDYGRTADGRFYYAMEYLDGIELLDVVKRGGPVPVSRAAYLLRQACAGLAEAHAKGLVHRDIKPENIMVCVHGGEYDVVKILDYGLVKNVAEPHTRDLTRSLKVLGTPLYMAPERFKSAADVDRRTDIYAIGAVAFFMLSGRELFEAADDVELANKVLNEQARRPSAVAPQPIPLELDLLVTACLEKRREDRPQQMADIIEALDALAARFRWTQREAAEWWARHRPPAT